MTTTNQARVREIPPDSMLPGLDSFIKQRLSPLPRIAAD